MQSTKLKMDVTPQSQTATKQAMFVVVSKPSIKLTKTGDKIAMIPLVRYNPKTKKSEFTLGNAFIPKDNHAREEFYLSLDKRDLVKIDFTVKDQFTNIRKLFLLPKKSK